MTVKIMLWICAVTMISVSFVNLKQTSHVQEHITVLSNQRKRQPQRKKLTAAKPAAKKATTAAKPAAKKATTAAKPAAKKATTATKPAAKKATTAKKPAAKK
jgi:hypothetical protein